MAQTRGQSAEMRSSIRKSLIGKPLIGKLEAIMGTGYAHLLCNREWIVSIGGIKAAYFRLRTSKLIV
jgi:hypothetical protein